MVVGWHRTLALVAVLAACDDGAHTLSNGAADAASGASAGDATAPDAIVRDAVPAAPDAGRLDANPSHGDLRDVGPTTNAQPTDAAAIDAAIDATCCTGTLDVFEPWSPAGPRPADERLCPATADPAGAPDPVFIDCALDGARYAPPDSAPTDALHVVAYNIERGFHVDAIIDALRDGPAPAPDVLLLSEADRGCARTDGRHVTDDLARALQMDYAFATEFVELNRQPCEHGNAVLSRFPLGNVTAIRHATNDSWFDSPDEPRLGGRVAVRADVQVGDRFVRVYAVHFESAIDDATRTAQAAELAADGLTVPIPVLIGGDMNAGLYSVDVARGAAPAQVRDRTARALLDAGYRDTHDGLPFDARVTHPGTIAFVLDLIFTRGLRTEAPRVGIGPPFEGLSDHRPIWVTLGW